MSPEIPSTPTKVCPTCGTRQSEDALRCLVCGTDLVTSVKPGKSAEKGVTGSRMPEITLSLPVALLMLLVILGLGATILFLTLRSTGRVVEPTMTPTETVTLTPTLTSTPETPTPTSTPEPSPTPFTYQVAPNDTCITIARVFDISVQSILLLNNLSSECILSIGRQLLIPHPTPTITPLPSATLNPGQATEAACEKISYTVQTGDTLGGIARFYNVPMAAIRSYNGLTSDVVISGITLEIPLCEQFATPGPSPTNTPPPPYPAPNLLLPADGVTFSTTDTTVGLQWASVGTLNSNEFYAVTIIDVTEGQNRRLVEYTAATNFTIPRSFRHTDNNPRIYRWSVGTVRQVGTDASGNPIYESAGATSNSRVFSWVGGAPGAPAATTTPTITP